MEKELSFKEHIWEIIDDCCSGGSDIKAVRRRYDERFEGFIRRLKETHFFMSNHFQHDAFLREIDRLVGEKPTRR